MLRIGAGFEKTSQSGGTYISLSIEKEILQAHPALQGYYFNLFYNKEQKTDKSPQWTLVMAVKEEKDDGEKSKDNTEEIPF